MRWLQFIIISAVITVSLGDFLGDLLGWTTDEEVAPGKRQEEDDDDDSDEGEKTSCNCRQATCDCCVHFNLTSIVDLGGPGCVHMQYLGQEKGVALNISYGESLLHSDTIVPGGKKASCLDLISSLAQVCAQFAHLERSQDGLSGCLHFYPSILGAVTDHYDIGCFKMAPNLMEQDFTRNNTDEVETTTNPPEEEDEDDTTGGTGTIGVVTSLLEDFLGLNISGKKKPTTTTTTTTETPSDGEDAESDDSDEEEESRAFKSNKIL